jgi:hypothetical protein
MLTRYMSSPTRPSLISTQISLLYHKQGWTCTAEVEAVRGKGTEEEGGRGHNSGHIDCETKLNFEVGNNDNTLEDIVCLWGMRR